MHKMWKGSKGRGQGPRPQVKPDCWLELRHSPGRSWLNVLSGALTLLEVYRITGPGPIRGRCACRQCFWRVSVEHG